MESLSIKPHWAVFEVNGPYTLRHPKHDGYLKGSQNVFESLEVAEEQAEFLARKFPGRQLMVCKVLTSYCMNKLTIDRYE